MRIFCFLAAMVSAGVFAAPQFVTPAMMKRNGLTDEQYELLWKQGKNPQIDIATARDWIFRASRYTNVVEWLEACGRSNDFARLSHKLQGDNFALLETNATLSVTNRTLSAALQTTTALANEYADAYAGATNRIAEIMRDYTSATNRAARLDNLRVHLVEQRDKAVLPTTKAIYQALIDRIDANGS